jgi:serine protease Do
MKLHGIDRLRVWMAIVLVGLAICGAVPAATLAAPLAQANARHWPPLLTLNAGVQAGPERAAAPTPTPAALGTAAGVTTTVSVTLTATPEPTLAAPRPITATQTLTPAVAISDTVGLTEALSSTAAALILQTRLQAIYRAVNPSVVTIVGTQQVTFQFSTSGTSMRRTPVQQTGSPDTISVPIEGPLGSGFVWDVQGHIITNNHVVHGADKLSVTFADGRRVPATLVGDDPDTDLAVLKVDAETPGLRPIAVADSTKVEVGQLALVIGNPGGMFAGSMTFGIVSGLGRTLWATGSDAVQNGRTLDIPDIIQVDAPINFGNSGGVLLDMQGRLIGVTSAVAANTQNIGFAVPTAILNRVAPAIIRDGAYSRPWTGFVAEDLWPEAAEAMGLPKDQTGAMVFAVTAGSPADKAGLRGSSKVMSVDGDEWNMGGDVVVAIDDQPVRHVDDIDIYLIRHTDPGQTVKLTVLRDEERSTLDLTLGVKPNVPSDSEYSLGGNAWLGIDGITLTPEMARAMNLTTEQKGVLVQTVTAGSPAEQAGLQGSYKKFAVGGEWVMIGGDVIVALDGRAVEDMAGLTALANKLHPGQEITLTILRDGAVKELKLTAAPRPQDGV